MWTNLKVNLTVYSLPIVNSPVTLVQCDDDTDGISTFNRKNNKITNDFAIMKFTYFKSLRSI
jgi:hypothetical protein